MFHYLTNPTDLRKEVGNPNEVRVVVCTGESGSGVTSYGVNLAESLSAEVLDLSTLGKWCDSPDIDGSMRRRFLIHPHKLGEQILDALIAKRNVVIHGTCDNMAGLYWSLRMAAQSKKVVWYYVQPDLDVWFKSASSLVKVGTTPKRWKNRRATRYRIALTLAINCLGKDEGWLNDLVTRTESPGLLGTGIVDLVMTSGVGTVELERMIAKCFSQAGLITHDFSIDRKLMDV